MKSIQIRKNGISQTHLNLLLSRQATPRIIQMNQKLQNQISLTKWRYD